MTRDSIRDEYFKWLIDFTFEKGTRSTSYRKLLVTLHSMEFTYIIPNDVNRAKDGMDLRWRFVCTNNYRDYYDEISTYLDGPCSILEMMVALAIRCEEQIMDDPDMGNRTSQWFWIMIRNLGLHLMTDTRFNKGETYDKLSIFLNREYEPNGKGGLFIVENSRQDLRRLEIWYQMCWYLNSIL